MYMRMYMLDQPFLAVSTIVLEARLMRYSRDNFSHRLGIYYRDKTCFCSMP